MSPLSSATRTRAGDSGSGSGSGCRPGSHWRGSSGKGGAPRAGEGGGGGGGGRRRGMEPVGREMGVSGGHADFERAPFSHGAFDVDRAAVKSYEFPDEREADARALMAARPNPADPMESLEEIRKFLRWDPR